MKQQNKQFQCQGDTNLQYQGVTTIYISPEGLKNMTKLDETEIPIMAKLRPAPVPYRLRLKETAHQRSVLRKLQQDIEKLSHENSDVFAFPLVIRST